MAYRIFFLFQVSLQNKQGIIQYDSSLVQPDLLVKEIEDMGFDASVSSQGLTKRTTTGTIHIEGMTCNSCVESIEKQIGSYSGVHSIKVRTLVWCQVYCGLVESVISDGSYAVV